MNVYRRSSMPPPLRTQVAVEDLRHVDVLRRILVLLNEPAAGAVQLARLIEEMPVLAARIGVRFAAKVGSRPSSVMSELALLGNRDLEAILLELLEDLTELRADESGVPPSGSVFPPLLTSRPPSDDDPVDRATLVLDADDMARLRGMKTG